MVEAKIGWSIVLHAHGPLHLHLFHLFRVFIIVWGDGIFGGVRAKPQSTTLAQRPTPVPPLHPHTTQSPGRPPWRRKPLGNPTHNANTISTSMLMTTYESKAPTRQKRAGSAHPPRTVIFKLISRATQSNRDSSRHLRETQHFPLTSRPCEPTEQCFTPAHRELRVLIFAAQVFFALRDSDDFVYSCVVLRHRPRGRMEIPRRRGVRWEETGALTPPTKGLRNLL